MTSYIMHIQRQQCHFCHTEERLSLLYSCEETGAKYAKLIPCNTVPDTAPLALLELPLRMIEICARCAPGRNTSRHPTTYTEWRDTLRRKQNEAREAVLAAARTPKAPIDLEDLA
jgi:hypothetical protein